MGKKYVIEGFVPACVTPFSQSGDLMLDAFQEILEWHLSWGATGFLVAGDNGEQWALSDTELKIVSETAMRTVKGRVPIFVGCLAISNHEVVAKARAVAEGGATGVAVMQQPFVLNATTAELCARFEAVAKAVDLPILFFNSPQRTGFSVTFDMMEALLNVAPIVAIKQANPNLGFALEFIRRFRDRMAVFIGNGTNMISARMMGSAGFISTGPDLLGDDIQKILNPETLTIEQRLDLQHTLRTIFDVLLANVPGAPPGTVTPSTDPAPYKAALNILGLPAGYPRDPVLPATPAVVESIRKSLDEMGIIARQKARRQAVAATAA